MKMKDWDTASFDNFQDVIEYFELEENFEKVFGKLVDQFSLKTDDKYEENKLINYCLNWVESPVNILWFSGFNEETKKFDVSKLEAIPKNIDDAKLMMAYLEKYINENNDLI